MTRLSTAAAGAGTQTAIALTYIIQPAMGLTIQKIIWQPYNIRETGNTLLECSNYNGQKIDNYQTSIDSQPLTDIYNSCTLVNGDDWRQNSQFCEGTCILNRAVYQNNWFHMDSFIETEKPHGVPAENIQSGLLLDVSRTWGVLATSGVNAPGMNHYITAICQRQLTIHPINGIMFDIGKNAVRPTSGEQ